MFSSSSFLCQITPVSLSASVYFLLLLTSASLVALLYFTHIMISIYDARQNCMQWPIRPVARRRRDTVDSSIVYGWDSALSNFNTEYLGIKLFRVFHLTNKHAPLYSLSFQSECHRFLVSWLVGVASTAFDNLGGRTGIDLSSKRLVSSPLHSYWRPHLVKLHSVQSFDEEILTLRE